MSKSARKAKYRRGQREFRVADARHARELRVCCATNRQLPHQPDCQRAPGRCRDKVGYADRDAAIDRAKELSNGRGLMTVYRCVDCRLYHFGHPRSVEEGL